MQRETIVPGKAKRQKQRNDGVARTGTTVGRKKRRREGTRNKSVSMEKEGGDVHTLLAKSRKEAEKYGEDYAWISDSMNDAYSLNNKKLSL